MKKSQIKESDFALRQQCFLDKNIDDSHHAFKHNPDVFCQNAMVVGMLGAQKEATRNACIDEALESGLSIESLKTWAVSFRNAEVLNLLAQKSPIDWGNEKVVFDVLDKKKNAKSSDLEFLERENYQFLNQLENQVHHTPLLIQLVLESKDKDFVEKLLNLRFTNPIDPGLEITIKDFYSDSKFEEHTEKASMASVALAIGEESIAQLFLDKFPPQTQAAKQALLRGAIKGFKSAELSPKWIEKALEYGAQWNYTDPCSQNNQEEAFIYYNELLGLLPESEIQVLLSGLNTWESKTSEISKKMFKGWIDGWFESSSFKSKLAQKLWEYPLGENEELNKLFSNAYPIILNHLDISKIDDFQKQAFFLDLQSYAFAKGCIYFDRTFAFSSKYQTDSTHELTVNKYHEWFNEFNQSQNEDIFEYKTYGYDKDDNVKKIETLKKLKETLPPSEGDIFEDYLIKLKNLYQDNSKNNESKEQKNLFWSLPPNFKKTFKPKI